MNYHSGPGGRLRVSPREVKLTVERHLMLLGVPKGLRLSVRDLIVDAQALGLPALQWLDGRSAQPWRSPQRRTSLEGHETVDVGGFPALFVAPLLLDLALALHDRDGAPILEVSRAADVELLTALEPAARRYGVRVEVRTTGPDTARVHTLGAAEPTGEEQTAAQYGGSHLADAVHAGFDVDAALWWRLYHRSNDALTEDTPLSRGHAGALRGPGDSAPADPVQTDPDYVTANTG